MVVLTQQKFGSTNQKTTLPWVEGLLLPPPPMVVAASENTVRVEEGVDKWSRTQSTGFGLV